MSFACAPTRAEKEHAHRLRDGSRSASGRVGYHRTANPKGTWWLAPERDAGTVCPFSIRDEIAAVRIAVIGTECKALGPRIGCPVGHVRHGRGLPPKNGSADEPPGKKAWRIARRVALRTVRVPWVSHDLLFSPYS